jgi:hypothetical protein
VKKALISLVGCLCWPRRSRSRKGNRNKKVLVGHVQRVDESGTQLTLKDGTSLLTPPGATIPPGALKEGTLVVTLYREQENGDKVLTRLSLGKSEPVPVTPGESPKPSR